MKIFLFVGPGLETCLEISPGVIIEHWPPEAAENVPQCGEGAFVAEEIVGVLDNREAFGDFWHKVSGAS